MNISRLFFRIVFVFFVFAFVEFSGCVQSVNPPPDAVVIPAPVETPAIGGVDKPPDVVVSPAPVEPQEKGSDDFDLVLTPNPATPELDEADLSTTHTFQISLDKKPSEKVNILIRGPNPNPVQLDFSIEGKHKVHPLTAISVTPLPPFYSFDFTPDNWDVPRTITAQIKKDNSEDQGSSYTLRVSIIAKKESVAEFIHFKNKFSEYFITIRDNDRPRAPQTLEAFACNGSSYLYWRGNCATEGCFAGETSEYEIFYSLATDSVSESSSSFNLTLEQAKPSIISSLLTSLGDKLLEFITGSNPSSDFARNIRAYSHTSLTNGTPVFYKIRLNRRNTMGSITESSVLSDVVTANPTMSNDHAVFCPENGDGTAASPFRIKTGTHLQQIQYYRFAFFRLENDIAMADNFSTIGSDLFGFRGELDGQGNTISNVKRAIFEKLIQPGELRNLHLEADVDEEVVKNYCSLGRLGVLLNYNTSGRVERAYSTGSASYTIDGEDFGVSCRFFPAIIRDLSIGGLVGANLNEGTVQESFSTVQITVQGKTGSEPVPIVNVGGLVGENQGMLLNSFSTSTLSVDDASLNPSDRATRYVSNIGGVLGLNSGRGVADTGFHALGTLAVPQVSGGGAFAHAVLGEDARLNSSTNGGTWGDTTIWNLGSDSEYPCLVGLPDIANNPSDASVLCAAP